MHPPSQGDVPFTNFRFANSVNEPGIQVSDISVGLLGKMHTYLANTDSEDIVAARDGLNPIGQESRALLRDLIAASHSEGVALLHHVASIYDFAKIDLFLQFEEREHAPSPSP